MTADTVIPSTTRSIFGPGARFHHVGLGVRSIRTADTEAHAIVNRTERVSMAFVEVDGVTIELLEPLGDDSPIAHRVAAGPALLHLCFEVDDADAALESAGEAGFHRISAPTIVPEWGGRRIVWVFSRELGLVELVERLP